MLGKRLRETGPLHTDWWRGRVTSPPAIIEQPVQIIAETRFDIAESEGKVCVRIFKPEFDPEYNAWSCHFELTEPFGISSEMRGLDSLQALLLALKIISTTLYNSTLYRSGRLGVAGVFGADLFIPAPNELLDIAPYPF